MSYCLRLLTWDLRNIKKIETDIVMFSSACNVLTNNLALNIYLSRSYWWPTSVLKDLLSDRNVYGGLSDWNYILQNKKRHLLCRLMLFMSLSLGRNTRGAYDDTSHRGNLEEHHDLKASCVRRPQLLFIHHSKSNLEISYILYLSVIY